MYENNYDHKILLIQARAYKRQPQYPIDKGPFKVFEKLSRLKTNQLAQLYAHGLAGLSSIDREKGNRERKEEKEKDRTDGKREKGAEKKKKKKIEKE